MRAVAHVTTAAELEALFTRDPLPDPLRVVVVGPTCGGPPLRHVRGVLEMLGTVRLSGTPQRIYADVRPRGPTVYPASVVSGPAPPLLALDMIARSDGPGLERAILSALPYVDEIVVGIDDRSNSATRDIADAYADRIHEFGAAELGLSAARWAADAIDFAAARNLGRAMVRAPWALVIDTDEFIRGGLDLRPTLEQAPADVAAFIASVTDPEGARHENHQRVARTSLRWRSAVHNQLEIPGNGLVARDPLTLEIVHDTSLRALEEDRRRTRQRSEHIEQLRSSADGGDLDALYHLAAHHIAQRSPEAEALTERYRLRSEIGGILADRRFHLAMCLAAYFYTLDDTDESLVRADKWVTRALFDGARPEAFCLKGDIAEERGDFSGARRWYQAACAVEDWGEFRWSHLTAHRRARLEGLRRFLDDPAADAA